ncbi:S24 family peptidase [Acinetobacter baumannii]|uniref:S24 family peptidase n=1 Tax=Acinetobacter calcoaceticus/baumannii complex TaxID=909768 RepID=UPI00056F4901|nr:MULTISPECIES: S24 family peptidase [Acinetobacter calcoaceticus/baumannii complex]EKX0731964.1 helix-turn-helix transcriptional regulator [Acinetobacter baumannii]EKX0879641.1 helix-turn-helix transcriptional regulator [Acinetobacter baumannii]EKX9066727.1 helix-turn-helix transcriptional regulator [Acinetobacter baumannii]MDC5615743.1 helix-turn-helix transcriptional regulator [Acinetobacter baumannii]MDC5630360.1 helix-turn-helix transcriptional regulator [Acinetobacter baumannii]
MNFLKSNIEYLLNKHKTNPNELEQKFPRIKQSTVFRIQQGFTKEPRRSTLEPIAEWAGVSVNDLIEVDLSKKDKNQENDINLELYEDGDPVPDGYTAIDYYDEVFVSAGSGYLNINQSSPKKFFVPTYLLRECNVQPSTAKVVKVRGDSMYPVLQDGQPISVDMSATKIWDGEIYAFQHGDDTKVKYLFNWNEEGEGGFKATSRNEDKHRYPDEYYSPARIASEGITIIGQYWMKLDTKKIRR